MSTLELARLSELYLRPVAEFLQEGRRDEDEDVLVALLRLAPALERNPATDEQVARCVSLCREGRRLGRLLGAEPRSGPPRYDKRVPSSSEEAVAQGEQTAEQERRRLGIGHAPISDISELIASQGYLGVGSHAPRRDVRAVPAAPEHRTGDSREFIPSAGPKALLLRP